MNKKYFTFKAMADLTKNLLINGNTNFSLFNQSKLHF